jgi:hypothetical protein
MKRPSAYVVGLLLAALSFAAGGGWTDASRVGESTEDMERVQHALLVLARVHSGRIALDRARRAWKLDSNEQLIRYFRWSDVSKTDAVLTRKLNPKSGKEERERKVVIYLRKDQSQEDLLLDIAHELTHASHGPSWDPYDPELTAGEYIYATIEADGGEVDALLMECRVGLELGMAGSSSVERCKRYLGAESKTLPIRHKVLADFYRVGRWKKEVEGKLGRERVRFPHLSEENAQLFSSTGQAPYPVALIREYEEITQIACENSRRRLDRLVDQTPQTQGGPSRAPAGVDSIRSTTEHFLSRRCQTLNF